MTTPKLPPPPRSPQSSSGSPWRPHARAPVGGDDVGADEVVAGQALLAHEPADAAAEGEARDAGGRDQAAGGREPEGLCLGVEVLPEQAGLGDHAARAGIDAGALIIDRSMTMPSVVEKPGIECEPPRTAISRPSLRAISIAA